MSDYTVTHGHLDDRRFQTDYDAWLDSLPEAPQEFKPTCGQCKFYQAREGRAGFCTAKRQQEWVSVDQWITTHPERDLFDDACDRYVEEIPF